jgi:uncharacterized protein YjbJ (UPF0337 family)
MNTTRLKGDWRQLKGKVKERWGKLTDDDLQRIEGQRDQLAGTLESRYGLAKEEAEKQVKDFSGSCGCDV